MRLVGGYQNTKTNNEDFAITPYLFGVWTSYAKIVRVRGLGICWGHHSAYIGIGINIPKNYPSFKIHKK
jgi:hypothetical protein